jgi:translation initiation factor RLI1
VPTENLRFRETALTFKVAETAMEEEVKRMCRYEYPEMTKQLGEQLRPFCLRITLNVIVTILQNIIIDFQVHHFWSFINVLTFLRHKA